MRITVTFDSSQSKLYKAAKLTMRLDDVPDAVAARVMLMHNCRRTLEMASLSASELTDELPFPSGRAATKTPAKGKRK